jgi:hypothetical protein
MWFGPPESSTLRPQENRVVLSKHGLARVSLNLFFFFFDPSPALSFYNSRSGSYIETNDPTGDPEVVKTLYNIYGHNV